MKSSKKVLTAVAAVALAASLGAMVGCGGDPLVTSIDKSKVAAVYTFEDAVMSGDAVKSTSIKGYNAKGGAISSAKAEFSSELTSVEAGKDGQSWNALLGFIKIPALPAITTSTGVAVSWWMKGCAQDDWGIAFTGKTFEIHLGCISFYKDDAERTYVDNFFEGTGGTFAEGYAWDCIILSAKTDWAFVTFNFRADGGLDYYVNGQCLITKPADGASNGGLVTIKEVNEAVCATIGSSGVSFGTANLGLVDNLIFTTGLTEEEVVALYNEQNSLAAK